MKNYVKLTTYYDVTHLIDRHYTILPRGVTILEGELDEQEPPTPIEDFFGVNNLQLPNSIFPNNDGYLIQGQIEVSFNTNIYGTNKYQFDNASIRLDNNAKIIIPIDFK